MPFDPLKQVPVGGSGLAVTRLGFGSASIAGLYTPVAEADAFAMIEHAWATGVRYFDTAPQYGFGQAEQRLGTILRQHPRDSYVLSTKVGRLLRPATTEQLAEPSIFHGVPDDRPVWDFSRDGVRRSRACGRSGGARRRCGPRSRSNRRRRAPRTSWLSG